MFRKAVLILFLLVPGVSFAQYLEYDEMMEVLDVAADTAKISAIITSKGFVLNSVAEEETGISIVFESLHKSDNYFVGIYEDKANGFFTIIEYTDNPQRWDNYIRVAKLNDFAFSAMKDLGEGATYFTYLKGEMLMGLLVRKSDGGSKYQFSITR